MWISLYPQHQGEGISFPLLTFFLSLFLTYCKSHSQYSYNNRKVRTWKRAQSVKLKLCSPKTQVSTWGPNAEQHHFIQVPHLARPCTFFLHALFLFHQIKPGLQIQFSSLIRPCLSALKHTYRTGPTIHRPLPCHIQFLYSYTPGLDQDVYPAHHPVITPKPFPVSSLNLPQPALSLTDAELRSPHDQISLQKSNNIIKQYKTSSQ